MVPEATESLRLVVPFEQVGLTGIAEVGGKNASLGEMIRSLKAEGVRVPSGFATTAAAYRLFLGANGLGPALAEALAGLDIADLDALQAAGRACRERILAAPLPAPLVEAILAAYGAITEQQGTSPAVAVRSSATAEDLPEASFAGQQDTFLHIEGESALLEAIHRCYASLFNDRAISYRQHQGFSHGDVALSVGVQEMVRSDRGAAGVMFTLDTETGFRDVVLLTAAYGLGENVVQGAVNPDEWLIHKPTLAQGYAPIISRRLGSKGLRLVRRAHAAEGTGQQLGNEPVAEADQQRFAISDGDALTLARWACLIERHYSQLRGHPTPMDLEWAKDGLSGELFILQARPETVESRRGGAVLRSWHLRSGADAQTIVTGRAIGAAISSGCARVIRDPSEISRFQSGDLLVTRRTDPDWEPILKKARGVVTDQGGRTCHAAIIAREMGITAIVGTGEGTSRIQDGEAITVSCAEGDQGKVYRGLLDFEVKEEQLEDLPPTRTQVFMNVGNPEEVFQLAALPCDGVGLARLEFVIANQIRVHPLALLQPDRIASQEERKEIERLTRPYAKPTDYYLDGLSQGMARIAAAFYPRPVVLRFSDFKSNEYARLLGGAAFEPKEENPMLGWRGASRYVSPEFSGAFALECMALRRVREEMGLVNVIPMVPFCRTPEEADRVLEVMAQQGLVRGEGGLQVYVMCELPSNVVEAEAFAQRFDGFSIGSNDLTQLTLGLDRDSALIAHLFDERHPAVKTLIKMAIETAHRCGRKIGICGQAPSDHPEFARFLVELGIDSISLNPDVLLPTRLRIAEIEQELEHLPASPSMVKS